METIATSSAFIVQNSAITSMFLITGQVFWAAITLVGILTVLKAVWFNIKPRRIKNIK